ncbi:MAG: BREX system Lon protease-like protein BrxL [candidate division Zixibacteria bacterium]|nr:BREX system Lon protease-like protein BrxL [candidate division Zixibacteria bacterium]
MSELDKKINEHFAGLVVRKDLVKTVKGNAIVPSYVLEYLLGQYCATNDEASIQSGIETVKEVLRKHYVHRNEAGLIRSTIKEKGRHKVIDKVSVALNDKTDAYEATFANLGIKKVLIDSGTVKKHPRLLVSGVWCITDLEYEYTEDKNTVPWVMDSIKPIQLSQFNFDSYINLRKQFTIEEWIDLLIQSIGFNPAMLNERNKLFQLTRLIPFCERNYNLIELGPKGTGKSHLYSEFSPHGILISGGEVTVPKLFVNNASGKIGLVGYWDTVAFDEFAGRKKKVNKALVDIMKNYMANKSFSRGVETLGAEASIAFVGNTQHDLQYMLKHGDLFSELPEQYHDSAFLDRVHFYIPGWEVDIIRGEMFSEGYGFVVDYLAEILRSLRNHDYSDRYQEHFTLSTDISTRDRDSVNKSFSGLMKILYPHGEISKEEIEILLKFAIEGRKRVKDQLMRIDTTYADVDFSYADKSGTNFRVKTSEEAQYPNYYYQTVGDEPTTDDLEQFELPVPSPDPEPVPETKTTQKTELVEQHFVIEEGDTGHSYESLIGAYLTGAEEIFVEDPYVRLPHQIQNFVRFCETVVKYKEIKFIKLVTGYQDQSQLSETKNKLDELKQSLSGEDIILDYVFNQSIHDREIRIDNGWVIKVGRGLDFYQRPDSWHDIGVNDLSLRKCLETKVDIYLDKNQ